MCNQDTQVGTPSHPIVLASLDARRGRDNLTDLSNLKFATITNSSDAPQDDSSDLDLRESSVVRLCLGLSCWFKERCPSLFGRGPCLASFLGQLVVVTPRHLYQVCA